ncbi:MAG TPA: M1 family peptidase, partial [Candidatus Competibacteraceae bacterium]|nr:M1 family peptidase [Candidatus Competibacteraceae bacterium]
RSSIDSKPSLRLDVDPEFDVFRRLHPTEVSAALSLAFSAERSLIVIPSGAPQSLRNSYEALAVRWQNQGSAITVVVDNAIDDLPTGSAVWLLGWENRFLIDLRKTFCRYHHSPTNRNPL